MSRKVCIFAVGMMEQNLVIQRIKDRAEQVLPASASLWLYGSRARGDARPDSDYDLLILLDKDSLASKDYDAVFDLRMLGIDLDEEINPTIYPKHQWDSWHFVPFHDNVEHDKIVLR